jgi:hypothetical protein
MTDQLYDVSVGLAVAVWPRSTVVNHVRPRAVQGVVFDLTDRYAAAAGPSASDEGTNDQARSLLSNERRRRLVIVGTPERGEPHEAAETTYRPTNVLFEESPGLAR